jgi:hypothetical protein
MEDIDNNSNVVFRFSTKKEYENALSKILILIKEYESSRKKSEKKRLEMSYEELMEEYMIFCEK